MPVELRKRKAPPPPPEPPAKKQTKPKATKVAPATEKVTKAAAKAAETVKEKVTKAASAATTNGGSAKKPEAGDVVTLEGFGGEVETNDGEKTTLKALVDESKAGVVLFTYPKASTPGCTKQVCFFRDSYEPFTAAGLAIYGLSGDSPNANTAFKEKQKLPYPLLCDPSFTLIGAIGLKKAPKGTTRGVFVVDKSGKVLAAQPGGPEGTLNVVKAIVKELGASGEDVEDKKEEPSKEEAKEEEKKEEEEAKPNGEATAAPAEEEKKDEDEKEDEKKDDEVLPDAPPAPAAEEAKEGEEKKE